MIQTIQAQSGHSLRRICQALRVPRSSHYHAAQPTLAQRADEALGERIAAVFREHRRRYGYRRIWKDLQAAGHTCAPDRVRRLMRARALQALVPRTSDGRADAPSPNLLAGEPLPQKPNEAWAGDITFIPTQEGWLYLAVVLDLCSRRILGWALADHLRADLVTDALRQALASRRGTRGVIFASRRLTALTPPLRCGAAPSSQAVSLRSAHSDRGSQYGSRRYRRLLEENGLRQSMSARANPYHNAWRESLIGRLKTELLQGGTFRNSADARTELFAYIEGYYNTQRRHSSLNYLTPASFEASLTSKN